MTSLPQRLHVIAQEVLFQHPSLPLESRKVVYQVIERLILEAQCSWEESVIERCQGIARCGCSRDLCAICQVSLRIVCEVFLAAERDEHEVVAARA